MKFIEEEEDEDSDVDEETKRINKMANDLDSFYKQQKEYAMEKDKKLAKKEEKEKGSIGTVKTEKG